MSHRSSRSASSPAGPFTALKNAAVGTANRLQDINQHAANYVVDTLRGRSTRKRSSSRSRSRRRRRSSSGRKMQDDLMDIHDEEKDLRDERRKLDEKTLKMFERGLTKAEAFDKQLDTKIKQAKTFAKDKYLDRWEQRYHTHMTRVRKEQKARVVDEIQYFKRNIAIFKERIEVSTTTETLEQNVTDTLYTRNFVTIVGADIETSRGKAITEANASFLDKFYTFRTVYTIETKYKKGHHSIVRNSNEVADLHKAVNLYVPSVVRKIVRAIKDSYQYYKSHLETLFEENAKSLLSVGVAGIWAASKRLTHLHNHHAVVISKASPLFGAFGGPAWLAIVLASWTMYKGVSKVHTYRSNSKLLKNRKEHLQKKITESNLFLNMLVFFVAFADAQQQVEAAEVNTAPGHLGRRSGSRRKSRSSNFAERRSQRLSKMNKTIATEMKHNSKAFTRKNRAYNNINSIWRNVFGPRNPKTENHDVQAAKVEVAKFFNQTDTERFFRPIVDILKLELLKTKKLEILESGNDDAQQAFDKLQDEIKSIKFAQTNRAGPHVGKSNRMSIKSLLANRTTP